ncbi:hypothetical protein [Apibacter adventoris]|uniref:hypothetical protein n=1 Tax=Apibacter adventoris TaxID=1679466 RepID=UPI0011B053B8|nr:hypothetical protein [Apibacter adventoris]
MNIDNLGITLRLIIGLLLFIGLLIFIWEFLLKRPYFENQLGEKEKLKEYAFVLENISLMKLQMNNSEKSNN